MPQFYIVDGIKAAFLPHKFANAAEAESYAESVGVVGKAVEKSVHEAAPEVQERQLNSEKMAKIREICRVTSRRCSEIAGPASMEVAISLLYVDPLSRTPQGQRLAMLGEECVRCCELVADMPALDSVKAFDAEIEPEWP